MTKQIQVLAFALTPFTLGAFGVSQEVSVAPNHATEVKVVVAPSMASTDSVIAIPPETSWTGAVTIGSGHSVAGVETKDLTAWLRAVSSHDGLQSNDLQPWHITIAYDQFDEQGHNIHGGVFDELWAGPRKYRVRYQSDSLNQTDYATEQGLFRLGDQRWPNRAEIQVRAEIADPFSYAASRQNVVAKPLERTFGPHSLDCAAIIQTSNGFSGPNQYCFEHGSTALRYVRGWGWNQTTYNDLVEFQGRSVAREVDVSNGGHPFLKLRVKALEVIPVIDEAELTPPADAVRLQGKRLTGVQMKPIKIESPQWPASLGQQEFTVTVELVVGKDGHVLNAHASAGPPEAYKAAEAAARKWTFQPYLVLGEPAEVETKIGLAHN